MAGGKTQRRDQAERREACKEAEARHRVLPARGACSGTLVLKDSIVNESATYRSNGIVRLRVDLAQHYAAVGIGQIDHQPGDGLDLGAAMRDLDLAGTHPLVERPGVTCARVALVFQDAVLRAVDRFKISFIGFSNPDLAIVVGIIGQIGMLLDTEAHGCTFFTALAIPRRRKFSKRTARLPTMTP